MGKENGTNEKKKGIEKSQRNQESQKKKVEKSESFYHFVRELRFVALQSIYQKESNFDVCRLKRMEEKRRISSSSSSSSSSPWSYFIYNRRSTTHNRTYEFLNIQHRRRESCELQLLLTDIIIFYMKRNDDKNRKDVTFLFDAYIFSSYSPRSFRYFFFQLI